jgi:hypothetical protein
VAPPPRTYLRSEDLRAYSQPNPGIARSEEPYLQGRYFEADCLGTDLPGNFVHITANKVSGYYQVAKVSISTVANMPSIGIIADKTSTTRCFVQTQGIYVTTGLIPGLRYWIDSNAQLTSMMPYPTAGNSLIAQAAGQAISDTELMLTLTAHLVKLNG